MTLGLRERIGLAGLAAAAAALLTVLFLVGPGLRRRALEHTQSRLVAEARLMARIAEEPLARGAGLPELDALVDEAAREVRARVTVVALDGRVLGDSSLSGPDLLAVENHGQRPEVRAALSSGTGSSVRYSATVHDDLLYAAVAIRRGGKVLGVARVADTIRDVDEQAADLRRSVVLALAVAFLVAALLAAALSAPLAGPLHEIMQAARALASGDLSARSRVARSDEIGELARILNQSADQLQARLTEIARDRARTDAILSSMESGLLAVDHAGKVVLANDSLRQVLGLSDPLGRHYLEVIRHPEVSRVAEAVLRTGRRQTSELSLHRQRRSYAVAAVSFPGAEGAPSGAVLTFQDVTDRRRLEEIRRDFVANASHELRTPLTSIRGFVEALEDGGLEEAPTARRFLGKIRGHADRMAALVADLLELSRLEAGERPPQWEDVALEDVVDEALASISELARGKAITLARTLDGPSLARTDPDRLRRILENLLENAIKYTGEGGHVGIAVRREGGAAAVEVHDDGPGIPAEHLPRIFERFYRVDKARSREMGGTGLGLSIVKHLAESIEASVQVESEPGKGSCFTVRLPLRS
jgi:two-component system, OmpR family, phosphate regulon sensor histidine kinase PhoR